MYENGKKITITTVSGVAYLNRALFKNILPADVWEEIKEDYGHIHGFEEIEVEVTAICQTDDDKILMDFYYGFRDYGLRDYAFGILCDGYDHIEESIKRFVPVVLSDYMDIDFLLNSLFGSCDCCNCCESCAE